MLLAVRILFIIVSVIATVSAYDLIYSNIDGNIHVETGPNNYVLSGSTLISKREYHFVLIFVNPECNSKLSLTVNGDIVTMISLQCLTTNETTLQYTNEQLKRVLTELKIGGSCVDNTSSRNVFYDDGNKQLLRTRISPDQKDRSIFSMGRNTSSFFVDDASKPCSGRIILGNSIIIYFYSDGNINTKSFECLSVEERQFVESNKPNWSWKELTSRKKEALMERLEADRERHEAEQERLKAEQERHEAEQERLEAEQERHEAEQERRQVELEKSLEAEQERLEAEQERHEAEQERRQVELEKSLEELEERLAMEAEQRQWRQKEREYEQAERQKQLQLRLAREADERQKRQQELQQRLTKNAKERQRSQEERTRERTERQTQRAQG